MTASPHSAETLAADFPGASAPPTDFDVLHWCTAATYKELADDRYGGDTSQVGPDDVFATTYGMDDAAMAHLTVEVGIRLNAYLAAKARGAVVLATGAGLTVSPNSTVKDFVGTIYNQAMGQNP